LIYLCLLSCLLTLSSNEAHYSGREVELEGAVEIEHANCHLTAESARICGQADSKESIEEVELHGAVVIQLDGGGTLECDHAFLHSESLQGRFAGGPVRYHEMRSGESISLECERMDIEAGREESGVRTIHASGQVRLAQGERITASADEAIYLTQGELLQLDPMESGWWQLPDSDQPGQMLVRLLDTPCEVVILRGNVAVEQAEIGRLESQGSVYLVRGERNRVDRITSTGMTQVAFADDEGGVRWISCPGRAMVDQEKRHIYLRGVEEGEQIHYVDSNGELFANAVDIDYISSTSGLEGAHVVVSGDIRLRNQPASSNVPMLVGMADRLEYSPDSEMMKLEASAGKRVVFLDEVQDARVSARQVLYDRKSQAIEGVGNVRFNLSDRELVNLKTIFATE